MVDRSTKITDFVSKPVQKNFNQSSIVASLDGARIQVTNSFPIQFSYLAQFLQFALQNSAKPSVNRSEYTSHLGLTNRHSQALCSVAVVFDLIYPRKLTITSLGKVIAEGDPYIDYAGTIWVLHYVASSNKKWLIWNTLMNETFPSKQRVTQEEAKASFSHLSDKLTKYTMTSKIPREITVVLDAYSTKGFSKLSLIQKQGDSFVFQKTTQLPPEILAAIILVFRQRYHANASAVSIESLMKESNSPGRILNMDEEAMRRILEQAKNKDLLYIERKADLDQIRFREGITVEDLMKKYYQGMKNE
jgi:hypothetical protein